MGFIREPEGIDFVINGKPLTEKQKQEISEFIRADKERRKTSTKIGKPTILHKTKELI